MKDMLKKGYEKVKNACVKNKTAITLVLVAIVAGTAGYGIKALTDGHDDGDSILDNVDLGEIAE